MKMLFLKLIGEHLKFSMNINSQNLRLSQAEYNFLIDEYQIKSASETLTSIWNSTPLYDDGRIIPSSEFFD